MSALRVATQPRAVWPKMPWAGLAVALTIGLAIGLTVGATMLARTSAQTAISAPRVTPAARSHAGPAAVVSSMTSYRQVVAALKVAEGRHDFAAQSRFGNQLKAMLTAETIGSVYQEHARLQAGLATAQANRDYRTASRFTRQLAAICGADAVKDQLAFCN